jgi:serine protease Do
MIQVTSAQLKRVAFIGLVFMAGAGLAAGYKRSAPAEAVFSAQGTPAPVRTVDTRQAAQVSDAFVGISESVTPAVVRIQAEQSRVPGRRRASPALGDFMPDDDAHAFPQVAGGSGFLVSPKGHILTNNHVIDGADRITVTLVDKRSFEARIVGRDLTTDVAVIKIDAEQLPFVRLGDSDQARVGEWVVAIGNPGFGEGSTLDFTVTGGIISAKGRPLRIIEQELRESRSPMGSFAIEDFIQTDAVINPGNSGGPLLNLRGEVIGINTAIASSTGYNEGYGFAIPANLAKRVLRDLVEHGHVRRPLLGINIVGVTKEDADVYNLPRISGVLIEDFASDSPARKAGLDRNDVITSIDGKNVESVGQLQRLIAQHQPGDVVDVEIVRYGTPRRLQVRLTQATIPEETAPPARTRPAAERLGIEVGDLTPAVARQYRFDRSGGVVITRVNPLGIPSEKRIEPGLRILAINRVPVARSVDADRLLRKARSGDVLSMLLQRPNGQTLIANVRVP